jgi:hypothetical protein
MLRPPLRLVVSRGPLLEGAQRREGDPAHDRTALGVPEAVAQQAALVRRFHLALRAIRSQSELGVHSLQRRQHALSSPP